MGKSRDTANLISDGNIFVDIINDRVGIGSTIPTSQLNVSSGPVVIGSGPVTGTASQTLQVTGGAYISNNTGIGTTNPQYSLDVLGDINLTGTFRQNGSPFVASRWTAGTGDNIYRLSGNVGVGTTNPGEKLQVDGNVRVGISTISNYIAFRGTTGDNPGGYNHTYVGERIWDVGSERSELLLFKGNDISGASGPDRIRLAAGEIRFDTYTAATSGTFEGIGTSANITNKFVITGIGSVGIGTINPSSTLSVGGTITELYQGQYWNVVTQADVGIGASQIPLNQYLGQLAFLDEYGINIPQNSQTAAYTLVRADNGKHISITTGGVTVPAGVFEIGDAVTVYNNSGSNQTITQGGSVTLRLAGVSLTGNRTLAQYGLCTIFCVASNTFVISGAGLS